MFLAEAIDDFYPDLRDEGLYLDTQFFIKDFLLTLHPVGI